jgi:glycosyltransferase involved in cell wall biosynthesis
VSEPEVVVVCSNVSNNCLGRALLLAALIKPFAPVRVAGVNMIRGDLWAPASGFEIEVEAREMLHVFQYPAGVRWLRERLTGAKVVVSKPLYTSLGMARAAGVSDDRMLLDVDDWEVGLFGGASWSRQWWDFVRPHKLNSFKSTLRLDATIARCPHRTVSNSWLQQRYGGVLLPHVRDTSALQPDAAAREAARAELDMAGRFWVGFVGTIRQHKGVDVLLSAVSRLGDDVGLYLAGIDAGDPYTQRLLERARAELPAARLRLVPTFDFRRLGYWLSAADVLSIPSRASEAATGQIPAKLFDALAMGIPAIVSDLNDMAGIVEGAGLVVPAGDVEALAAAVGRLQRDEALRHECGRLARERAVARYSYASASARLEQLLSKVPVAIPV